MCVELLIVLSTFPKVRDTLLTPDLNLKCNERNISNQWVCLHSCPSVRFITEVEETWVRIIEIEPEICLGVPGVARMPLVLRSEASVCPYHAGKAWFARGCLQWSVTNRHSGAKQIIEMFLSTRREPNERDVVGRNGRFRNVGVGGKCRLRDVECDARKSHLQQSRILWVRFLWGHFLKGGNTN